MNATFVPPAKLTNALRAGTLAGLAGGAAEVLWISIYSRIAGGSTVDVATGITSTVFPTVASHPAAILIGLAIHFVLAVALGLAVAGLIRQVAPQLAGSVAEMSLIIATLVAVWAVNFLIVLPVVNPSFVHIVPMPVSFASKLLFGVVAAFVLRRTTMAGADTQSYYKE
jgi:hypothetical protein